LKWATEREEKTMRGVRVGAAVTRIRCGGRKDARRKLKIKSQINQLWGSAHRDHTIKDE